jgi:hypothetical protein
MPDSSELLIAIRDNLDAIRNGMDADSFAQFDERRRALVGLSATADTPEAQEQVAQKVAALVHEYPAVEERLGGLPLRPNDASTDSPPPEAPVAGSSVAQWPSQATQHSTPTGPLGGKAGADATKVTPAQIPLTRSDAGAGRTAETSPTGHTQREPRRRHGSQWTPELRLQAFKEVLTGAIGLLLVGFTVYMAFRALNFAGDAARMSDSKDVLQLMTGLAGVVLGYYFGRVPAEARAAQAQDQAASAVERAQQIGDKGEELAAHAEAGLTTAQTRGDDRAAANLEQLRRLRAEMRAMGR